MINPSADAFGATISVDPRDRAGAVTADVVQPTSLDSTTVTWNGSATPSIDLTEPGEVVPLTDSGELRHDFPAYSITLLRWSPQP